ncbi:hypothetical protein MHYP_G00285770 [Metynnis hypsauchen]
MGNTAARFCILIGWLPPLRHQMSIPVIRPVTRLHVKGGSCEKQTVKEVEAALLCGSCGSGFSSALVCSSTGSPKTVLLIWKPSQADSSVWKPPSVPNR